MGQNITASRQALSNPDRVSAIRALGPVHTLAPEGFARLTRVAARLLRAPVSLATIIDQERQLILGEWGLGEPWKSRGDMPLEYSYCQYALGSAEPLLIPDARLDARVSSSPAVSENNSIAYAGIPLVIENRHVLGTLCVVDNVVREWSTEDVEVLQDLAASVVTEISLRAEILRAHRHTQRLDTIGKFSAGIAHDFRNVLTAIQGNAAELLFELDEDDPRRHEVQEIQTAADRATALTRQLLSFGSNRAAAPAPLDVNDVVATLAGMLRRLVGARCMITVTADSEPLITTVDRSQLEQVITNLVVNARDAMDGDGCITISTFRTDIPDDKAVAAAVRPGSYAVIAVSDTGSGIAPEVLPRLFERFFTTKGDSNGNGLGLATSEGIIREAGGFIDVTSRVGVGSTFSVHLPLTAHGSFA